MTFVCNPNAPSGTFVAGRRPGGAERAGRRAARRRRGLRRLCRRLRAAPGPRATQRRGAAHRCRNRSRSPACASASAFGAAAADRGAVQGEGLVQPEPREHRRRHRRAGGLRRDARARRAASRRRGRGSASACARSATRCRRARRTSSWRASPGAISAGVYEALKQRRILVRYFATPELYDALRITVGTDDGDRCAAGGDGSMIAAGMRNAVSESRRYTVALTGPLHRSLPSLPLRRLRLFVACPAAGPPAGLAARRRSRPASCRVA